MYAQFCKKNEEKWSILEREIDATGWRKENPLLFYYRVITTSHFYVKFLSKNSYMLIKQTTIRFP